MANKYYITYFKIIEKAKSEDRNKSASYCEAHHILPKCLGGNNSKENIVLLSAREHFICHALLVKMYEKNSNERQKLLHAFMLMKGANSTQYRYMNSRIYESIKKEFSEYMRQINTGKVLSEEHKDNIRKAMTGRVMSEESKKKISEKASNRKRRPFTPEERRKIAEATKRGKALKAASNLVGQNGLEPLP